MHMEKGGAPWMDDEHRARSAAALCWIVLVLAATLAEAKAAEPSACTCARRRSGPALRLPVNAKHVVVVDDATGNVLMARDAAAIVPITSLTKVDDGDGHPRCAPAPGRATPHQ